MQTASPRYPSSRRRRIEIAAPRIALAGMTVGNNIQSQVRMTIPVALTSSPVLITMTSSDPTRLLVSTSLEGTGAPFAALSSAGPFFYVHALASAGDVTITATAPGLDPATATVHLEPSYFAFTSGSFNSLAGTNATFIDSTVQTTIYLTHASSVYQSNEYLRSGL